MPTRVVREGILDSERIGKLTPLAELFYRKLMSVVDDYGRFEYVPTVLRARLYSQRLDAVTVADIESWMDECESGDRPLVITYLDKGKRYLEIQEFNQQLKARESKYPAPPVHARHGTVTPVYGRVRQESDVHSRASPSSPPPTPSSPEGGVGETRSLVRVTVPAVTHPDWAAWWALWCSVRGNAHESSACAMFLSVVTGANVLDLLECTASYLAGPGSDPPAGYNPQNFLQEMAADNFKARWPARKDMGRERTVRDQRDLEDAARMYRNFGIGRKAI